MLIPIGVTQTYLDIAWLATLNSYGSKRGSYAHRSFFVQSPISRSDELNELKLVLSGLKKIDYELETLTNINLKLPY